MTGSPTRALHVRQKPCTHGLADADIVSAFPPVFQHFSRKYQHLPTNIFGRTFHPPWAFCVLEACEKPVALAGYKNKQTVSYTLPRATEDLHYFNGIISE